jgi:hypothetical protein
MECKDYRELFTSLLTETIGQAERKEVEAHLDGCHNCRREFEAAQKVWNLMAELPQPEPSETMSTSFNAILSNYKNQLVARKNPLAEWINTIQDYWSRQARPRLAFSLLMIAIGLSVGYLLHQPSQTTLSFNRQIDSLSSQVSEMKQVMMLSLLQDPSASQRILAVSYSDEINNVDLKVIDALFATLNEDPNVNVRLATLDALVKKSGIPKVREGLVRSIILQESPIMQSAIADVMVRLQEKKSVPFLQQLLNKKDLNKMVKTNIEKSIHQLI